MSQHDYVIDDQNGLQFLADLNAAIAAIVSSNSGATAPASTFAHQWWADTTAGILKRRNAANSAWINVMSLATGLIIGTDVQAYSANIPTTLASQAEMEAGTEANIRSMSPLRIKQAIAALAAGGMAFSGVSGYSANQTLTTAAYGRFIYLSGTMTLTLPVADVGNVGKVITAHCYTTGVITVATQSSQNLYYKGTVTTTSAVVMGPGDKMQFINVDGSQWMAVGLCGVGSAQTWQDVSGSRAVNTTYYNTTGRPIMVFIASSYSASTAYISVGGVHVAMVVGNGTNPFSSATFIVPPGASYILNTATSFAKWAELR